ncbi:lipocalin family protein [Bacteroides caecigallinarum]|uniref:lipocalin family protein n=1 Tax=Bacteroides caecigallinarum TaxID=1411144 RepID=UPI00195B0566|nr:lipocalin family protein [Bacteroides caecigallinarum]MBM6864492.1 lipocalin family protein [Bacteroides caecigallinarum]
MKTFRFIGMVLITMLMCVNFTSCKDSEDGPSSNSLIGVWEGIEADSWSIVPGSHDENEEWWASSPDKETDNGVDISNYRIEFNSDMFYRIYLYNENSKMWNPGGVGKWSVSGKKITLVSYDSGDKKYNEENPDEYNILEHKDSKITLEYYKNTPASENYRKMTFRQIATKDEMFDTDDIDKGDLDINGKKEYPSKLIGKWMFGDYESAVEIYENGLARYLDNVDGEWTPNDDGLGDIEWFVIDGVLYWNEEEDGMPDAWILYEIKNIANDEIKLEFKGVLKEDGTYDDYYSDEIGEIEIWTKLE